MLASCHVRYIAIASEALYLLLTGYYQSNRQTSFGGRRDYSDLFFAKPFVQMCAEGQWCRLYTHS